MRLFSDYLRELLQARQMSISALAPRGGSGADRAVQDAGRTARTAV